MNDKLQDLKSQALENNPPSEWFAPIEFAGKIPNDAISDGDVLINAWDTHSLLGNGMKNDSSLDGDIGASTLVHFLHGLRCAMEAESISWTH